MRTVVAVDVDGVLNSNVEGSQEHLVEVPVEDVPASPFVRGFGKQALSLRLHLREAHGEWLRSLLERGVEVVWATTWEEAANKHVAPLLGLPPLPVAITVAGQPPRFTEVRSMDSASWKAHALSEVYGGEAVALVWLDDSAHPLECDTLHHPEAEGLHRLASSRRGPTLVRAPFWELGLTGELMGEVDAWVTEALALEEDSFKPPALLSLSTTEEAAFEDVLGELAGVEPLPRSLLRAVLLSDSDLLQDARKWGLLDTEVRGSVADALAHLLLGRPWPTGRESPAAGEAFFERLQEAARAWTPTHG